MDFNIETEEIKKTDEICKLNIIDFEPFIINDNFINNCISKSQSLCQDQCQSQEQNEEEKNLYKKNDNYYNIKFKDNLFWIFYILKYGFSKFEYETSDSSLNNNLNKKTNKKNDNNFASKGKIFILEKEEKFKMLEILKRKKDILKKYKLKNFNNIEEDLIHNEIISLKTFFSLILIENLNIILLENNKYYELKFNNINSELNIIEKIDNKYYIKMDFDENYIENIKEKYLLINNFDSKLKSIGSYKLDDLIDLAKKLNLEINKNEKKKITKKYLYDLISEVY